MISFLLAALLIELTPGPNMGWLAALAATRGRASAFAAVAGIATGLSLSGVVAAAGLSAIVASSPFVFEALRWAGALYLLYLAYDAWHGAAWRAGQVSAGTRLQYFRQGLISNALNPKAYLFYGAVIPHFVTLDQPAASQIAVLTAIYVAVATFVHAAIAMLAGGLSHWLSASPHAANIRRGMAVAIALTAAWFFVSTQVPA